MVVLSFQTLILLSQRVVSQRFFFFFFTVLFPGTLIKLIGSPRLYFSLCLRNGVLLSICVIIQKPLSEKQM